MSIPEEKPSWLEKPLPFLGKVVSRECLLFGVIVLLAIVSRSINLGDRAMSHDESIHVYYSYLLAQGQGYFHTPLSHGPLQFHLIGLFFFLLGSSDFIARLPHAIASILTIVLLWKWRKYLGNFGTILAAFFMLISPYLLFYGRYARNEPFVALFGILTLYAILSYLETGKNRYLYLLTLATVLHFTAKETAFIYTAQAMLFLVFQFILNMKNKEWKQEKLYKWFVIALIIGIILLSIGAGIGISAQIQGSKDSTSTSDSSIPGTLGNMDPLTTQGPSSFTAPLVLIIMISGAVFLLLAVILLFLGYGWSNIRHDRSFDMLILLGTFVLPQLAAFPVTWLGYDPLNYTFTWPGWDMAAIFSQEPAITALVWLALALLSMFIGFLWDYKRWITQAGLFWIIFFLLYSTFFTNPAGFATGTVGSLGYWLVQQGVARGAQPWYYYLLLQIPIYEYLPALGVLVAILMRLLNGSTLRLHSKSDPGELISSENTPVFSLLFWWTVSSILAFTVAGEKMPWLTVHITLPMILLSAWGLGQLLERLDWSMFSQRNGLVVTLLLGAFLVCLAGLLVSIFIQDPPFQGYSQSNLLASGRFLFWLLSSAVCGGFLFHFCSEWKGRDIFRLAILVVFSFLAILTIRTSYRAAFINFDQPNEYLVYAHGSSGIKSFIQQAQNISRRVSGGFNDLVIAYDAGGETQGLSWPVKWYLRVFPNARPYFTADNTLREATIILADPQSYSKVEEILGEDYYKLETQRMIWPEQGYFNLTLERIQEMLVDRNLRNALFQIWWNRDYSLYGNVTGQSGFDLSKWILSDHMRMYIRKADLQKVWEYNLLH